LPKYGLWWRESGNGTKVACQKALKKLTKDVAKAYKKAVTEYWWHVYETARRLCIEYGAIDTWALYQTIELIWEHEYSGDLYEIAISSTSGVEMTAMIRVGGTGAINPKTGRYVDYAAIVHDGGPHPRGGGYFRARPFLTDAIVQSESFFQTTMQKHLDGALTQFTRDY